MDGGKRAELAVTEDVHGVGWLRTTTAWGSR